MERGFGWLEKNSLPRGRMLIDAIHLAGKRRLKSIIMTAFSTIFFIAFFIWR
jgi:hypothetical protein